MSVSKLDTPGRFIPLLIVLLFIGSVMPLGGLSNSSKNTLEDSANIFKASSSNESYDLFIGAATSESGGDGSISTMEPDGSSQEESILSTLEFYTNEMISDIQIYGEGSTPAIEISVYLKFEGNEGASADINFVLKSGSSVVESEQITLEDPCTSSNPFGGNSCSYSVNIINIEIPSSGFTVENGKRLGLEVDASIDGCQGSGIGGGDGDCDVMMQYGDIDSTNSFSKIEVRANALSQSAVKVHMTGSGWTDSEVLEWSPNHRSEFRTMQFTLQIKDSFGRDDIETVNLIMSTNSGATVVFNKEFEDDDLILDNDGLVGNYTFTYPLGIDPGDYDVLLEIQDIQGHTVLFQHQGVVFVEHDIYLTLPSTQPDTVLIAPGMTSSVEFLVEHTGSDSSDLQVVFDLARSLPSTWSESWDKPGGYSLNGGGSSAKPILQIDVPNGDLSTGPDKLEIEARAFADIDGTTTEVAVIEIVLDIEEVGVFAEPRISIFEDFEHQIQIVDSTRPEFYDETLSHYVDADEVGDFFIDVFNSGFDSDTFFIRVNAMPTSWQYKFYDNDTGLELTEEGINSVTPSIGSHDILTIRMDLFPPAEREAQDIGLVSLQITSAGESDLRTDVSFTVHRTFGILAEVISDSDAGELGRVESVDPGDTVSYSVRVTDSTDTVGQTTWKLINPKDLERNKDSDIGYSNWDYSITDSSQNDVIVVSLESGSYADVELEIELPSNVEAGNHTVYLQIREEGVESSEARYFDLPFTVEVSEEVQPGNLPITQKSEFTRFSSEEKKSIEFRISNDNNVQLDVFIELEEPEGWEGEISASSTQVGGGFLFLTLPAYSSKDFFVELTAPSNLKDGSEVDFTLKVTPMDDEVPYAEEFNQISKFTFKTECRGVSCLLNEIYQPEPQTIALFAGLLAILFLAVYRRGRYNSSNYLIEEVPQELEMESDEGLDIPEPVSEDSLEDDDDLELLDALDEI
tara:strand:+ start:697 stop:3609 length:2913 start_codon:yes stop_codon:yes gene_type:complete